MAVETAAELALRSQHAEDNPVEEKDDQTLMERVREGDRKSYRVLLERYWSALLEYARGIVGSPDDAEDVVQSVFIRVWQHRARWTSSGSASGYLYRITRNLALNRQRERNVELDWKERHGEDAVPFSGPATPHQKFRANTLREEVEAAIDSLPERRREAFRLSRFHGLSYSEIAEAMGITPQTVANQMSAALADLREALSHLQPES